MFAGGQHVGRGGEMRLTIVAAALCGAACERFRGQVPKDLRDKKEVTEADCQKLFERLRQFKVQDGVPGERVDQDKDQIIRTCLDKAKPGTVACFIASRTYEEARRCP